MATLDIASPIATRTMTLAATTGVISIPAAHAGQLSGLYLYCASAVSYQIQADGRALVDGSVAPTADYDIIPAATRVPIPIPAHQSGYTGDRLDIAVWSAGAATLHIAPWPVSR